MPRFFSSKIGFIGLVSKSACKCKHWLSALTDDEQGLATHGPDLCNHPSHFKAEARLGNVGPAYGAWFQ